MKILIASDIHGSAFYAEKLLQSAEKLGAERIILLGDIYNHGPRNCLPENYNPMRVAELLNSVKDKLLVIKGNCDSAVDTMISEFDFLDCAVLVVENKTVFLTHGHVYNKDKMPATKYDAIIYGHFHTGFIEKVNDVTAINVGSISLPKNKTAHSFAIINEKEIQLIDVLTGECIVKSEI